MSGVLENTFYRGCRKHILERIDRRSWYKLARGNTSGVIENTFYRGCREQFLQKGYTEVRGTNCF
jgi:hypothetical protein